MDRMQKLQLVTAGRDAHRRRAKEHLVDYVTWTFPSYRVYWHHLEIIRQLEAVERGDIDRLMIVTPPRHGKSELASIRFPAWYLGRNPRREIIACAYGDDLVSGFGARLRNIMGSGEHEEVFGKEAALSSDVRARNRWFTNSGGVYRSAGVGGGITGFGANLFILDDPIRGFMDANSEVVRNQVWNWWTNDAYTRLMKGGAIVVIGTRWHEDDPIGRLLERQPGEWTVVHFPAINGKEEALWPDEFSRAALERIRATTDARTWQSLYQGDPLPEEGIFFKQEWFRPAERRYGPRDAERGLIRVYAASDYAVTGNDGDYTVHLVVGITKDDRIQVLDMWRGQTTPNEWTDAMLDMAKRWKPLMWAEGKGGVQKAAEPYIAKRQRERKIFFARMQIPETVDKRTRAISIQGRMAAGMVEWPMNAPWFSQAQAEQLSFDAGKYDDIVDTLSLIGKMLDGMAPGKAAKRPDDKPGAMPIIGGGGQLPPGTRQATMREIVDETLKSRRGRRQRLRRYG